jgi:hypothetical protein
MVCSSLIAIMTGETASEAGVKDADSQVEGFVASLERFDNRYVV